MIARDDQRGRVALPVAIGIGLATAVAVAVVARVGSQDPSVQRGGRRASETIKALSSRIVDRSQVARLRFGRATDELQSLPTRIVDFTQMARVRFERAKAAFRDARAESERALVSQLQEAKQRGSVPPV
jgi:hypothetical protein